MKALSPLKQGFFGGLAALFVAAMIFVAGNVAAQGPYYPAKDLDASGKIDVVDIQAAAASWGAVGSPRATLHVFSSSSSTTGGCDPSRDEHHMSSR